MRQIDWATVVHQLGPGHPLKFIWEEKAQALTTYSNFWKQFYRKFPQHRQADITAREFAAGERVEVDYAGDPIEWIELATGEIRSISKAQIKELYSLQWLSEGRPVLLIGQTGLGKTFIAQAAELHACACGKSVLYMTVTTWLENLALARSSGTYLRYRDKLARPDLLIFDDFGMRKLSSTEAQDLCEILEARSRRCSQLRYPSRIGRRSLPIPSSAMRSATVSSTRRS